MTKIYIYCLFDKLDNFLGVYSSLKSVHRDALTICNQGTSPVFLFHNKQRHSPSLVKLRNIFKGECDLEIRYASDKQLVKIFKTKLKE